MSSPAEAGFALAEVLVGGLVLVIGLIMMAQFFASAIVRVAESDMRLVLHQVATQEIEAIRGLPYTDVGTSDGHPQGTLVSDEYRDVGTLSLHIRRDVVFWTDDTYSGPYPANYRRVTVTLTVVDKPGVEPLEVTTNVAGGAEGGTLDITVVHTKGNPVKDARILITDTQLSPNVLIKSSILRTNVEGRLLVPGLPPDESGGYNVEASKTGYSSDTTDAGLVVENGLPYTAVTLVIDKLCGLVIYVDNDAGELVQTPLDLLLQGPDSLEETVPWVGEMLTLSSLRFSTDLDPYVLSLPSGQGYDPEQVEVLPSQVALATGTTQDVTVTSSGRR